MNIAIRIIKSRREKKLSQQGLSGLIGVSRSALAQWETELSRPGIESLRKLSEVLDVSFEWLVTGCGNQYTSINSADLPDEFLAHEINRLIPRLSVKRKKAVLGIIKEME